MTKLVATIRRFVQDEKAATATEYAVLLALIAVVVIVGALVLGPKIQQAFTGVADQIPDVQ